MSRNVFGGILNTHNLIRLRVGNLNGEFVLDGHDDFDGVEGVESEVFGECCGGCYLGRVDFVEVLDYGDDAVGDFRSVDEGLCVNVECGV